MIRFIGLDVHKKFIQICILDADGNVLEEKRIPTDHHSILEFAQTLGPGDHVALECCTFAWAVHDLLEAAVRTKGPSKGSDESDLCGSAR